MADSIIGSLYHYQSRPASDDYRLREMSSVGVANSLTSETLGMGQTTIGSDIDHKGDNTPAGDAPPLDTETTQLPEGNVPSDTTNYGSSPSTEE